MIFVDMCISVVVFNFRVVFYSIKLFYKHNIYLEGCAYATKYDGYARHTHLYIMCFNVELIYCSLMILES